VEFEDQPGRDRFGSCFALKEGLERIFGRPVDLVVNSTLRNPYFRDEGHAHAGTPLCRVTRGPTSGTRSPLPIW